MAKGPAPFTGDDELPYEAADEMAVDERAFFAEQSTKAI
jgi:hypothetical protein